MCHLQTNKVQLCMQQWLSACMRFASKIDLPQQDLFGLVLAPAVLYLASLVAAAFTVAILLDHPLRMAHTMTTSLDPAQLLVSRCLDAGVKLPACTGRDQSGHVS